MNSHNRIVTSLLFMVVCTPHVALAAEQSGGRLENKQMHNNMNLPPACRDDHDTVRFKKRSQPLIQAQVSCSELSGSGVMTEKDGKAVRFRKKITDQEADILEKLLLDSTASDTPSRHITK